MKSICTKCKTEQELEADFYRKSTSSRGYQTICKSCANLVVRDWVKNNPEKNRAIKKRWSSKNRVQKSEYSANYRKSHPEKCTKLMKNWRAANPEKYRTASKIAASRRRARKANATVETFSESDWKSILEQWHYHCAYCLMPQELLPSKLTMDHVVSLASGGTHSKLNIVPACEACNSSKRSTDVHIWLTKKFGNKGNQYVLNDG